MVSGSYSLVVVCSVNGVGLKERSDTFELVVAVMLCDVCVVEDVVLLSNELL